MPDVVQNIRIRIGADEHVSPAFNSVNAQVRNLMKSIRSQVSDSIGGSVAKSVGDSVAVATRGIGQSVTSMANGSAGVARLGTAISATATAAGVATVTIGVAAAAVAAIGAAAVAASLAVVRLYGSIGEAVDATAKLTDRLGATVEGFTALQYNAQLSGVAADQISGGFEKMLATIGKAVNGSTEAGAAFRRLGLDAGELSRLAADDAFNRIAVSIGAIPTASGRAAATMEIFGKSGQSLLPILTQGEEGLRAMRAEAVAVGAVFSRMDAAGIEAVNDAITRMQVRTNAYLREIAVGIGPQVEAIAANILDILPSVQTVRMAIWGVVEGVKMVSKVVGDVVGFVDAYAKTIVGAGAAIALLVAAPFDAIGFAITKVLNLLPGVEIQFESISSKLVGSITDAGTAWRDVFARSNANAVEDWFESARNKSFDAAKGIADRADRERQTQRSANLMDETGGPAAAAAGQVRSELTKLAQEAANVGLSDVARQMRDIEASAMSAADKGLARFYVDLKQSREEALALGKHFTDLRTAIAQIGEGAVEKAGREAMEKGGGVADAAVARVLERARQDISAAMSSIGTAADPFAAWEKGLGVLDDLKAKGIITAEVFDDIRRRMGEAVEAATKTNAEKNVDRLKEVAERVREAIRTPVEEAEAKIRDVFQAVVSGHLSLEDFKQYATDIAKQVGEQSTRNAARGNAPPQLSGGENQSMFMTGQAANAREQLNILSQPMKSISADTARLTKLMGELVGIAKQPQKQIPMATTPY